MKLQAVISVVTFAAVSTLSAAAFAADAPAADAPPVKKVKPHNHMEEKMGVAPAAAPAESKPADAAKADENKADKPKAKVRKHSHPRDAK